MWMYPYFSVTQSQILSIKSQTGWKMFCVTDFHFSVISLWYCMIWYHLCPSKTNMIIAGLKWLTNLIYNTLTFQSCHVRILLVRWRCAQMCTSISRVLSVARRPWAFLRCCQRLGRTPVTTSLLLVQMLSLRAGLEGAGWQNSPGEPWWYKPARTCSINKPASGCFCCPSSEGCLNQPASRVRAACVQRRQLSRQGHACPRPGRGYWSNSSALLFTLSKEEVGAGTFSALPARWRGGRQVLLGGRMLGCGGGRTLSQKAPNLPHFPAWRGSWGLKLLVKCRAFHPQGQDGGSPALMPGFYAADPQGVARVFWDCKDQLKKHVTVVVASSSEVWHFNASRSGLYTNRVVQNRNPSWFNSWGPESGERSSPVWLNHMSLWLAGNLVTGHWAHEWQQS